MEPACLGRRHNVVLADTSDIHAFSVALHRHAADLSSVAADLTAAQVSTDAFGSVGYAFVTALNDALNHEARRATQLAGRLAAATSTARAASDAYEGADHHVGQSISLPGT